MSFGDYFFGMMADEHGRRTRSFLSDMLLAAVVFSLFITAAFFGGQFGGIMADRTTAGYSALENPEIPVRQSVRLSILPGSHVNQEIVRANQAGRLNLVWEDDNTVTVVESGTWNPKKPAISMATIYKNRLADVKVSRGFVMPRHRKRAAGTSNVTWPAIEIAFGIVMILLVVVFAIGDYLSVRDLSVPVTPIANYDVENLSLPQPYAQRAQCALSLGKDLRILRRNGRSFEVLVIRNSAFPKGSRVGWVPVYEQHTKALTVLFESAFKRLIRRPES